MTKRQGVPARTIQRFYLSLPEPWRAALPRDMRGQVRDWLGLGSSGRARAPLAEIGEEAGQEDVAPSARGSGGSGPLALEERLWSGYAARAIPELEALAGPRGARPAAGVARSKRAEAAWALARWHAAGGDVLRARSWLARLRELDPGKARGMRALLLESDCLRRTGAGTEARALLAPALARAPDDPDLCLAMANSFLVPDAPADPGTDAIRLDWLNRIYRARGLAEVALRDPGRGLAIGNITATAAPEEWGGAPMPRVSVIMPAHRAETTIGFALESLLAQSWPDLEIIVVDDASPDGTAAVAEAIARRDPRITVIRQETNRGGYAARNRGWRAATGDFITTHDADDWSHPEKIALQMRYLRDHPEAPVCFSDWVRATPELGFGWLFRAWSRFAGKSMSSILIPRPLMEQLGGWDVVRVGGDTEILRRIQTIAGDPGLSPQAMKGVPLAFALHAGTSLTRQSATHVRTMLYGARREYAEASDHWRRARWGAGADPAALRMDPAAGPETPRPFPAPPAVLGRPGETREFDLLVVTDFAMKGGSFVSTFNTIRAAVAAGMRVGVFHWRRYDLDMAKPLDPRLRDLVQAGGVTVVSAGETARARTLVFGYPVILADVPDPLPAISCDEVIVVVNQMAARLLDGGDPQYDPAELRATLAGLFGTEGIWAPISGLVARLMRADPRYPAPSDEIWIPLIETGAWCDKPPRWRGAGGALPVLGRHARDAYTKWPSDPEALRAAYCAGKPCVIELMGGANRARDVIGAFPSNWVVHPFDTMDSHAFLDRLDFFLHYPHETYIEEFGRAVLEALARGLPAVLPPVFRETFGEAAVYAEPGEVWARVAALWADEAAYLAQAARGQAFVHAHSDWERFPARLAATLGRETETPRETAAALR
ncbi:glycosyltransferase [Amaricoccus solimangrovi]|uniref:Glycosyltransferase n=1 Tax=Amaricoccus solimangrovi TaxID=2589815 RepID=A0A501WMB7_9RHOB|nr:glycosyltransferase [Amaricoccus solimangrovi]TPE48397.1 glycosyltransferase [Amaricoccus solimangrovi]